MSVVLCVAMVPTSAVASSRVVEGPQPADQAGTETVDGALERGDLTTARELTAPGDPVDPERARERARVCEQAGDYACATQALEAVRDSLPENSPERAELQATLDDIEAQARGTVADEPASTRRAQYDRERAAKLAALAPKATSVVEDTPPPAEAVKIHRKWYFWVTLGAIVASAAAITGIAIKAATSTPEDDLDTQPTAARLPPPRHGLGFRF